MAIAITALGAGAAAFSGSDVVTTSLTPVGAPRLYLAKIEARFGAAPGTDVFSLTGMGLPWTRLEEQNFDTVRNHAVFWAYGTASAGALTFTEASAATGVVGNSSTWSVIELSSTKSSSIFGTVAKTSKTGTPPLALTITGSPGAGDITVASFATYDNTAGIAADANWATVSGSDTGAGSETRGKWDWSATADLTPDFAWTEPPITRAAGAIGFIVQAAAAAGGSSSQLLLGVG